MGDYRVYSRILIAVPVLLVGQFFMESRFVMVMRHIVDADLLKSEDRARMDDMIATLRRLRDSLLPEATILVLLIVHTLTSFKGQVDGTPWLAYRVGPTLYLTPAGWYAIAVSATLFQFLLGLGLWQWLLWAIFAFKLSRLDFKAGSHSSGRTWRAGFPRTDINCLRAYFFRRRYCHWVHVASGYPPSRRESDDL